MSSKASPPAGETIGARLKRLRLERGMSQRELAAPGVSYAYISRIEAGTRQPSVKALRKLAAKLGVTADYLETGSDLDEADARELRLADLELALRLGESDGVEAKLEEILREATTVGDAGHSLRARVSLATLSQEHGDHARTATLLEEAIAENGASPLEQIEVYSSLGRAYASSGRTAQAAELFERCLDDAEKAGDGTLAARYAALLSYALSDMGELGRAEQVVSHALELVKDSDDPYMRVRLYWSLARLAYSEGREAVALANVRRAIALLQATDDSMHLARAHVLAAHITLARENPDAAERHLDKATPLLGVAPTAQDLTEVKVLRSRIATHHGKVEEALRLAREALETATGTSPVDEGYASAALASALSRTGDSAGADAAYETAVARLEENGRWRDAAQTCRAWGQHLRDSGEEQRAMDVLDRAAQLGLHAAPSETATR